MSTLQGVTEKPDNVTTTGSGGFLSTTMATTGAAGPTATTAPAATTAPTTTTSTLTPDTEWPRSDALDAQFLIQAGRRQLVGLTPLYSQRGNMGQPLFHSFPFRRAHGFLSFGLTEPLYIHGSALLRRPLVPLTAAWQS